MTKIESKEIKDLLQLYEEPKSSRLCGKITYSSLFLLPCLGINLLDRFTQRYFINAFIDDFGIEHDYKTPVFVLFQTSVFDATWKIFEANLLKKENFLYSYPCGMKEDKHLIMFVFEMPILFREDYSNYLEGNYSKFTELFKRFFSKSIFSIGTSTENPAWGVINKTETMRKRIEELVGEKINKKGEYWPVYDSEREVYRFNLKFK